MKQVLKVLLVDDKEICLKEIALALNNFKYIEIVGEISQGKEVLNFLQDNAVDLIFLDIELEDTNGFELARVIQSNYPDIMIVFLTGHVELALDGYIYQPLDFLTKPINLFRLERSLSKARNLKSKDKENANKNAQIGVHIDGGLEIIKVKDISYIEKIGRKIYIIRKNGEKFTSSDSLQKLENIFCDYNFFRSHQSFLVPIDSIKSIHLDQFKRTYKLQLEDVNEQLPLSRDKYIELKKILLQKGLKFY
ncbi:response regulator transcription factor [Lysinibacillus fusiformis]|uniref:LytR/AlgR family response regulator transcription factor n=1 Tax=Lysinibacillus fusiformis TaxID=28031 RepID=UPI001967F1F9|nr:LytTR family DNA-binding domain-containing protein [Lysinibacillus fusiformis]QSB08727.1 response regulator transcription factor [Lysinibacillus fusiformis]